MANLISAQTGNFTSASTWQTVDSVSELDSEAGSTAVSTSTLDSATFVLPATAVDGLALKLAACAAAPSGTFTVTLRNSTTSTNTKTVTVNISDFDASGLGWFFFKFGSSFTPNGTDSYLVRVQCSATGSQVTLFRNSTANNWSRKIRTTTTQAPAASNHLIIVNQFTAAATSTAVTVTMDNTATTSFGPTVSGGPPEGIVISGFGTLTFGTSASTAYYLKWKGIMQIAGGGTLNIGSSGSRIPISSSVVLEMDSVAAADSGIRVDKGGTFKAYGATTTSTTTLTADAAAADTSLTVGSTTGWQIGDTLIIPSTDRTGPHTESKTISSVTDGTHVVVSALANAHGGTAPITADVINLTRNVKIRGVNSTTGCGFFYSTTTATVVKSYVEMYQLGKNADPFYGNVIATTTGSYLAEFCGIHDFQATNGTKGFHIEGSAANNFTINGNAIYNMFYCALRIDVATSGTSWVITNNVSINCSTNGNEVGWNLSDLGGTFTGNVCIGSSTTGFNFNEALIASAGDTITPTVSGNSAHTNGGKGFVLGSTQVGVIWGSMTSWRNSDAGVGISGYIEFTTYNSITVFGNANQNITIGQSGVTAIGLTFNSLFSAGDTAFATTNAFALWTSGINTPLSLNVNGATFDSTTSPYARHTNLFGMSTGCALTAVFNKCLLNPSGAIVNSFTTNNLGYRASSIAFQDYNQTSGDHRFYTPLLTIQSDSVIYHTASPSERITPNSINFKAYSGPKRATIGNGTARTVSVWVRRSIHTDVGGADYNGNQPRLIVRRNDAVGITADTILATGSAAIGTWEQLSGTTSSAVEDGVIECYVDCDGTAGWINDDDWNAS